MQRDKNHADGWNMPLDWNQFVAQTNRKNYKQKPGMNAS